MKSTLRSYIHFILDIRVILVLAFVLRLVNLNQSFWLDEAAQVIESARPFSQQLNIISDFHPPLFHILLHFWMLLGTSEPWVRLLSVLFGICSVWLVYKVGMSFGKKLHASLAALLLAVSPYHIWYSQEARPYSLFVFMALLSTWMLLAKRWKLYAFTVALTLYSLYFAPFLFIGHIVYIFICERNDWRRFLISLLLGGLLFVPWLPFFFQQLAIGTGGVFSGWSNIVSVPAFKAIPLTVAKFVFGRGMLIDKVLYGAIIIPAITAWCVALLSILRARQYRGLLLLFFVPLLAAQVVTLFIPVTAPQRLIFLLPFFCFIVALSYDRLSLHVRAIVLGILLTTNIIGIGHYYIDPYVQREQWRQAVTFIEQDASLQDIALFVFPDPFAPVLWYSHQRIATIGIAPGFTIRDEDLETLPLLLTNKYRVYLFDYLTGLTDPANRVQQYMKILGYKETSIENFPGVGFVHVYEKT